MSNREGSSPSGGAGIHPGPLAPLRIGLVAGESSGDMLGAGLIRSIRAHLPEAEFAGMAGPRMVAEGCTCWEESDRIAIMGIGEVLRRLGELIRLRHELRDRFEDWRPDVFVGIDSPDFNLGLEIMLRGLGIPTVHYVSPSLWAWRSRRIKKVARAADLVLCLLPFETGPYEAAGIASRFVGHPLADDFPARSDRLSARQKLGLDEQSEIVALMPGSRITELRALTDDFLLAADWLAGRRKRLIFLAPMANSDLADLFQSRLSELNPDADVRMIEEQSHAVMSAANVVLLASGTATLEAALIKRPMVVAYRVSQASRLILKTFRLLKVDQFALPNLLAGETLVPEILQDDITPKRLGRKVLEFLENPDLEERLVESFDTIHTTLRRDADQQAATAVIDLLASENTETRS